MPLTGEKKREYQRQWIANRRADYLKDKCCVKCGSTDRLEIDHVERSTKVNHNVWSWSEPRRNEELAKCQVLCESCHNAKTAIENSKPITHGAVSGYKRGCRCDLCHEALIMYWRNRRNPS